MTYTVVPQTIAMMDHWCCIGSDVLASSEVRSVWITEYVLVWIKLQFSGMNRVASWKCRRICCLNFQDK
jgi:hypothetical protein